MSYISPPFFKLLVGYMPTVLQWLLFIFLRSSVLMLRTKLSVRVHTVIGECRVHRVLSPLSSLLPSLLHFPSFSLSPSLPTPPLFFPLSLSPYTSLLLPSLPLSLHLPSFSLSPSLPTPPFFFPPSPYTFLLLPSLSLSPYTSLLLPSPSLPTPSLLLPLSLHLPSSSLPLSLPSPPFLTIHLANIN